MHYIPSSTVDAMIRSAFTELMKGPFENYPTKSRNGSNGLNPTSERIGIMFHLTNPLARLSRTETRGTAISALGELLWYLSGKNDTDYIEYYSQRYKESDEAGVIYGGYGPRIFGQSGECDQLKNVIQLISNRPDTRRAVIQIFSGRDILMEHKDIPCTCTLQFLLRKDKLFLVTYMRSNDAYLGLPHDTFAFTMIQEIVARSLGVEMGEYFHSVGSLHLYSNDQDGVRKYVGEGHQSSKDSMPPMPNGDPFASIKILLEFESKVRHDRLEPIPKVDQYWQDLARLLKIYAFWKAKDYRGILALKAEMHTDVFDAYIDKKVDTHL